MKLFIRNIEENINEMALEGLFKLYGNVVNTKIVYDRITWQSKGYGFVEMLTREDGEKVIAALNGKEIKGKALIVVEADEKKK